MKHSVILTSFNRLKYVGEAIKSVLNQRGDVELIISDDGSNEETMVALRYFAADPRVILLTFDDGPRGKASAARAVAAVNRGLKVSTGDLIHYLSDDDVYVGERFVNFESIFKDGKVNIACGWLGFMDAKGVTDASRGISPTTFVDDPVCVLDQKQVVHRRECLKDVPEWDTIKYESDGVFFKRLLEKGWGPIYPIHTLVAMHRDHEFCLCRTQESTSHVREATSPWDSSGVVSTLAELWSTPEEQAHRDWLAQQVPSGSVLDVGCGKGLIAERLGEEITYTGVDSSGAMLEAAREAHPGKSFVRADILDLPFDNREFLCVCCYEVVGHLDRECLEEAVGELCRVSRNVVLLSFWCGTSSDVEQLCRHTFRRNQYTEEELEGLFRDNGFRVAAFRASPSFPEVKVVEAWRK